MIIRAILIDILQAWQQYGRYALSNSLLLTLLISLFRYRSFQRNGMSWLRHEWKRLGGIYILLAYCFLVISITILSRPVGSRVGVNLNFFATFSGGSMGMIYPLENILLFIPFGILFPLLWHQFRHLDYTLEVGLLFSTLIELIQFITKRGFLQTDDILMNVLGTLLGYILYRISSVIWHRYV